MIKKFCDRFIAAKPDLLARFSEKPPASYSEIVGAVVETIRDPDGYGEPDPSRITCIDHGDYQGTLVFVIGADGYQPYDYWYTLVSYGSCSGCDTLEAIRGYGEGPPTPEQANQYWTLALHIVQKMKHMGESCE